MPTGKQTSAPAAPAQERALRLVDSPGLYPEYVNRWDVIMAFSKYRHAQLNLKFAHRDAEELYQLLRTPSGGAFDESRIYKRIDEAATTANITRGLRSFLKKPMREDIVPDLFCLSRGQIPTGRNVVYRTWSIYSPMTPTPTIF